MDRLAGVLLAMLLLGGRVQAAGASLPPGRSGGQASDIPLPPPRPSGAAPPQAAQTATPDPVCARVLASGRMVAVAMPPVSGPGGCGIAAPVKLEAVILADKTQVPLEPPALIRCALAETLADWFRDDVAPLAQTSGGLAKILGSPGYECRSRNGIAGAKLSEHAKGNAFDLRGFVMRNGQTIVIEQQTHAPDFLAPLRTSACARFTTVLGPGSDSFHEAHLHVDLAERHNNYRICQWEVK